MSKFSRESVFLPIGEEEEFEIVEEENTEGKGHPLASDVAEADLKKTRARTAALAHEAESNIMVLQHLLWQDQYGDRYTC